VNHRPLEPGQLQTLILEHLHRYPTLDLTVQKLANVLSRSAGSVAHACQRLTNSGRAVRTNDHPRRYQAAPPTAE
jgi:hypothetical protein